MAWFVGICWNAKNAVAICEFEQYECDHAVDGRAWFVGAAVTDARSWHNYAVK